MAQDLKSSPAGDVDSWLREGVAAAKSGQRERARDLLMRVVAHDEENAQAWLWLSGVVDNMEDQEICLENVLALDPDNVHAQRGLSQVRQRMEAQAGPVDQPEAVEREVEQEEAVEVEDEVDRPPSSPGEGRAEPRFTPEVGVEEPASTPLEALDDPYLCPYCAAPTKSDDRRCPSCGQALSVKVRKREGRSTLLWVLIGLQVINTLMLAVIPLMFASLAGGRATELLALMDLPPSVTVEEIRSMLPLIIAISSLPFLFSLVVLIGMYVRWPLVYYLLLVQAGLEIVGGIVAMVASPSICNGVAIALAVGWLILVFQMEEDFLMERRRILLRVEDQTASLSALLSRADAYNEREMWAKATLYLQRALGMQPTRLDIHMALTANYIRLKRYDWAERQLEQARRIDPQHPRIERLENLLGEIRSTATEG